MEKAGLEANCGSKGHSMDNDLKGIPPVAEGVFTLPPYDHDGPVLLGGYCAACNQFHFPRPKYCPSCLEPPVETSIGGSGEIYSFTVIRVKAPLGLPSPYGVGYIDLKPIGLRIFCLLDPGKIEDLRIGLPVSLKVAPLGNGIDGRPCLRPFFTPQPKSPNGEEE
jgi:uncharacterized protein